MDRNELIGRLTELDRRATPGPWLNGSWHGQCHMVHRKPLHGHTEDPCVYDYTLEHGEYWDRYIALEKPNHMLVAGSEDGAILGFDDARLVAEVRTLLPEIIAALKTV